MRSRLRPDDWVAAALEAIAERGVAAVAVESLAPRLGASKGSFYWHFADRAALLEAAMLRWERERTDAVIHALEDVADPLERLRRLFATAFGNPEGGRLEAALAARTDSEPVAAVISRVTERRLDFLARAFRELGFARNDARHRALIAYSTYLGTFAVQQARPGIVPKRGGPLDRYVAGLLDQLTRHP